MNILIAVMAAFIPAHHAPPPPPAAAVAAPKPIIAARGAATIPTPPAPAVPAPPPTTTTVPAPSACLVTWSGPPMANPEQPGVTTNGPASGSVEVYCDMVPAMVAGFPAGTSSTVTVLPPS